MADPPPDQRPEPNGTRHISAEDARGGEIILRKRWERPVFIAGLVAAILFGLVVSLSLWG
jgi:hypothetical protein